MTTQNRHLDMHPFWGYTSPLYTLWAVGFLVFSSSSLAYSIIAFIDILGVFLISSVAILCFRYVGKIEERTSGHIFIVMVPAFVQYVFLLALSFISPVLYVETFFFLLIVPFLFLASGVPGGDFSAPQRVVGQSIIKALIVGMVGLVLSCIREPFGHGSLTIPTRYGAVNFLSSEQAASIAIQLLASTAGFLILFGYVVALYRFFRRVYRHYLEQKEGE
ncbi:MAG: hypothetical protein N2Z76_04840 [Treponemataceae bacterium]|nr:hypothetical protein [Treponemataceae bacterium]